MANRHNMHEVSDDSANAGPPSDPTSKDYDFEISIVNKIVTKSVGGPMNAPISDVTYDRGWMTKENL